MGRTSQAKSKLLSVAQQLIWEKSYHAVGVKEICQVAEVKPGSFYYFFESKEALALEALNQSWSLAKEYLFEPNFNSTVPALDRIPKLFKKVYEVHQTHLETHGKVFGCMYGSFTGEITSNDEMIQSKIKEIFNEMQSYFLSALNDASDAGQLKANISEIEDVSLAILTCYQGTMIVSRGQNNAEIIGQSFRTILKLIETLK